MKKLAVTLNVLAFAALFITYTEAAPVDRPAGVRRALQTFAGEISCDVNPRSIHPKNRAQS